MNKPEIFKKPLIEIAREVFELEQALIETNGEITELIQDKLKVKDIELPAKVDSYAHVLKRLETTENHFRAQAQFFTEIARGVDKAHARLKENLKSAMEVMGTNEILGQDFKIKMARSNPKVIIEDIDKIDGQFVTIETVRTPDKKLIAKTLEAGGSVEGVRLEAQASLRIFANKGD